VPQSIDAGGVLRMDTSLKGLIMSETVANPLQIRDTTANPAPLGLLAFGMTTVLLNFHNAGFYELNTMILAMGIFYGGLAQVIAGCLEWKKNNTFGTTAFTSYGMFWLVLVALLVLPKFIPGLVGTSAVSLGLFMLVWGIFTAVMFVGTLRLSRALQFVFGSLAILFFLLTAGFLLQGANGPTDESKLVTKIAGYEGIICGASAIYTGLAQVLNEIYGRTVMPLGLMKR
jgi:succinate-acetate transporter protein